MLRRTASLAAAAAIAAALLIGPGVRTAHADLGIPLPVPVPGVGGPCDIPGVDRVCGAVGSALDHIPNPLSAAAGFIAGEAEKSFTHWLADGAASVLGSVLQAADVTLTPDLGPRSFFAGRLQQMVGLSGAVALLFLLLAVGQALLPGDPSLIVSTLLVRLPLAFGATAALLFVTATAVAAVDQATSYVIGGSIQDSAAQFMKNLADAFTSDDFNGVGLALVALCALGTILVGILLYAELAIRAAVIYLAVLFLPLGLAASVWTSAGRTARRLADVLIAAILAKFVIVVSLWFAAGLLQQASSDGAVKGFGGFVIGFVVLLLAAAAPMVLLGLVAHAEHAVASMADTRHAVQGPPRRGFALAAAGTRAAIAAAGTRAAIAGGGGAGGAPSVALLDGSQAAQRRGPGAPPMRSGSDRGSGTTLLDGSGGGQRGDGGTPGGAGRA